MKIVSLIAMAFALAGCASLRPGQTGPDYKVLAVSHIDSTGLYWLEKLEDPFANGCLDAKGAYHAALCTASIESKFDSPAEEACELYGARLPTLDDYRRLLKDFDANADLEKGLSPTTYHDVALAFKDDLPYAAWTSTVSPDTKTQARFFSWSRGGINTRVEYRSVALPVQCVRKPR